MLKRLFSLPTSKPRDPDPFMKSYAQCGEDLILRHVFEALGIERVSYLDVGAHHPIYNSTTYLFYERDGSGVLVEPNGALCEGIRAKRPRDVCVNVAVAPHSGGKSEFYTLHPSTLSTLSKVDAEDLVAKNLAKLVAVQKVPNVSLNDIFEEHFPGPVHLVNLDIESYATEVLSSVDFSRWRPLAWCIETVEYSGRLRSRKIPQIFEIMRQNGYEVYADTYINTIFLESSAW